METYYGDIDKKFNLIRKIGSGGTSKVYLANLIDKPTSTYAVKIIKSSSESDLKFFLNEVNFLKQLSHPNVVNLIEGGEGVLTKSNGKKSVIQYLVLELVKYGELFDYIFFPGKGFGEEIGRYFFHQLLDGLEACHNAGIVHRDMKTENVMLAEGWKVKIADFGFATKSEGKKGNGILYTALGTASYASPELLQKKAYNGVKSDIFSLGVSLFVLVTGKMPFKHALLDDPYYKEVAQKNIEKYWSKLVGKVPEVSPEFQDLFTKIIACDPLSRPTIEEIKNHEWVKGTILKASDVEVELKARTKLVIKKKELERRKEEEQEKAINAQQGVKFRVYKGDEEESLQIDPTPENLEVREYIEEDDSVNPYTLYLGNDISPAIIIDDLYLRLKIHKNRFTLNKSDKKYKVVIHIHSNQQSSEADSDSLDFPIESVTLQAEVKKGQDDVVLVFSRIEGNKFEFHQAFNEIKSILES